MWAGKAPGCPQVTGEITLYDRVKRVDFAHRLLRDATSHYERYVAFPFALTPPHFRLQASNSVIEPVRDQLPGSNTSAYTVQGWVSVADERAEFTHGHLYSLLMASNFRTNFAPVQPSDVLFRYSLTSRRPGDAGSAAQLGEAACSWPRPGCRGRSRVACRQAAALTR
jgi:hypothetical protein